MTPLIENDAVVFGLLAATLALIFYTANSSLALFKRFYNWVPALLLCYFIPGLYNTLGLIDGNASNIYYVASRYLLPATLVLLTLSIDLPGIRRLGGKAIIMFFAGTTGIVLGGPLSLWIWSVFSPETVDGVIWRGMSALAGSWIGGGANMASMKEIFGVDGNLFGMMVAVDVIVANLWMAVLLWMAARADRLDQARGADVSGLVALRQRVEAYQAEHARIPSLNDLMYMMGIGFGVTALAHALATPIASAFESISWAHRLSLTSSFFWLIVLATSIGLALSFTRWRQFEGAGASKIGSAMLYVLVASIGMHMDLRTIFSNPGLFGVGLTWMAVHAIIILSVAKLIKAPTFYLAVGSQANVGGAASAPVVASAFHPSLAPVGVLLAVLGYAVGTYAAWVCGQLMRVAVGQ
ncbi:MAG: DUF819 domain-containing protein [Oceanococcus sp.]